MKNEEHLVNGFVTLIHGHKPDEVMIALCSVMCSLHRSMGVSNDDEGFINVVSMTLRTMLDEVPPGAMEKMQ